MHYIYVIQNTKSLKIYVGQTTSPNRRWRQHQNCAKRFARGISGPSTIYISRAMAKHGVNNFEFQVIETQEESDEAECFWIEFFNSRDKRFGYNIAPGGGMNPGAGLYGPAHFNCPLTTNQEAEILQKYDEGRSAEDIAGDYDEFGIGTVYSCLKRNRADMRDAGFYKKDQPAHNRLFTYEQEKEICSRYTNEILTITKLADEYSCDQSTIHKMLQRHGVDILGNAVHSKGRRYSPETEFKKGQVPHNKLDLPEQEIVRLYTDERLNTTQIGKKYGCARTTVIGLLNRLGVEMRKKSAKDMSSSRKAEILKDYRIMKSSRKVANKHGISRKTVMKIANA